MDRLAAVPILVNALALVLGAVLVSLLLSPRYTVKGGLSACLLALVVFTVCAVFATGRVWLAPLSISTGALSPTPASPDSREILTISGEGLLRIYRPDGTTVLSYSLREAGWCPPKKWHSHEFMEPCE